MSEMRCFIHWRRQNDFYRGFATSPVALRWMCNSPRTVCALRTTYIYVARTSNNKRDCGAWSPLLLAATVWSFAHMPLGFPIAKEVWLRIKPHIMTGCVASLVIIKHWNAVFAQFLKCLCYMQGCGAGGFWVESAPQPWLLWST